MNRKLFSVLLSIILISVVKCGYIHLQMFSDSDGLCNNLFMGSYVLEGACVDNIIIECSPDQKTIIAKKYESNECLGTPLGKEVLVTGGCVNVTSKFECTQEIDLPQGVNTIITVRHNSTEEQCPDYKQGLVELTYVLTNQCTPNISNPNKYAYIQTCDETSYTETDYKSKNCQPSTQTDSISFPLPVNSCTNTTDSLSSYQFCYIPNF
ncbi:hypothetical protein ACTA71_005656 [Dictyostelium dimigraforme]